MLICQECGSEQNQQLVCKSCYNQMKAQLGAEILKLQEENLQLEVAANILQTLAKAGVKKFREAKAANRSFDTSIDPVKLTTDRKP